MAGETRQLITVRPADHPISDATAGRGINDMIGVLSGRTCSQIRIGMPSRMTGFGGDLGPLQGFIGLSQAGSTTTIKGSQRRALPSTKSPRAGAMSAILAYNLALQTRL